ncbi:hypothetical protein [Burkholderia pseudomallei]|uniref:hypothetical protein n=1 Tax=Burkholderia pseudomallei TaxID=28450 RepID=UPI00015F7C84|nr:hypothetical protein [Burkholderia pseudomallei]AJX59813.1 hypothetical protein DP47_3347 [Burkholderia pseudomallei Pasteur 52237]EDO95487.1 hypothetical protein BURPSPAST_C1310 [Burkholderia pseudomallei Pasteur 52237]MWA22326.1 hypothetical protein [Burkholderia pseudomallei]VBQ80699.1 Uncharacterised protein [Burkholderia pseudomallei]
MTAESTIPKTPEQDERRVRACLSACAGLSTEALENGIVRKMLGSLESASHALDAWAASAEQHIPPGFVSIAERLPLMGEDHQQIVEKRGESITLIAWRYPPAPSGGTATNEAPAGAGADHISREKVMP